jgi:hypothetical protein
MVTAYRPLSFEGTSQGLTSIPAHPRELQSNVPFGNS